MLLSSGPIKTAAATAAAFIFLAALGGCRGIETDTSRCNDGCMKGNGEAVLITRDQESHLYDSINGSPEYVAEYGTPTRYAVEQPSYVEPYPVYVDRYNVFPTKPIYMEPRLYSVRPWDMHYQSDNVPASGGPHFEYQWQNIVPWSYAYAPDGAGCEQ